jgi:hypothetical protein
LFVLIQLAQAVPQPFQVESIGGESSPWPTVIATVVPAVVAIASVVLTVWLTRKSSSSLEYERWSRTERMRTYARFHEKHLELRNSHCQVAHAKSLQSDEHSPNVKSFISRQIDERVDNHYRIAHEYGAVRAEILMIGDLAVQDLIKDDFARLWKEINAGDLDQDAVIAKGLQLETEFLSLAAECLKPKSE